MSLVDNPEIKTIQKRLRKGMIDYMEPGVTEYTAKDVDECMRLVQSFLERLEQTSNKGEGMLLVEETVLALNDLNDKCEGELIETDQREDIAEIIIFGSHLKGYNDRNDDITEEWRDW